MKPLFEHILAQSAPTERIETHIELARWSTDTALLVGVALSVLGVYVIGWLYRHEARGRVSAGLRWAMTVCRVALLVLLGLIGLEPVMVNYVHRKIDAYTVVLADSSASMSLADAYRMPEDAARVQKVVGGSSASGTERSSLEDRLLTGTDGLLNKLSQRNKLLVLQFSDHVDQSPSANAESATQSSSEPPAIEAVGPATDICAAVRGSLEKLGSAPIAGVVLLSDGNFNKGESPAIAAEILRRRGARLHAVGIGDPASPINVVVSDISGPRFAFKNDPFSISVKLDAQNVEPQPLEIELLERRGGSAASATVVDRRVVTSSVTGNMAPVIFERKVAEPGMLTFVARVRPVVNESILSDNEKEILPAVQVLDDKMRVLLIAGSPSYDYRFVERMLERDVGVDVSTWLQSADLRAVREGNTIITELPTDPEKLFIYDAVILLDPDPDQLDPAWGSLLTGFIVEQGGGVLYEAGNKYSGKFFRSPNVSSLVDILPVVPDPDAELIINELGQYQRRPWPLVITDAGLASPILRLSENPMENREIWSMLDGAYWHFPVRREKPVAAALIRHSNPRMANSDGPHVLLATQFVGSGRSAFLGINTTWRWRRHDEKNFDRFWIQMIRYLVEGKQLGGRSRGMILTPRDQFDLGETVPVSVRALDTRYEPLIVPELEMIAQTSSSTADGAPAVPAHITLAPVVGREGYYEGRFTPTSPGTVHLSMKLPDGSGVSAMVDKDILIRRAEIEMQSTAMNRPALEQLAAATQGRYFDIDEAAGVADAIADCSQTLVTRERPRPLWDNGWVLAALVLVVTLEWILRRKARLL